MKYNSICFLNKHNTQTNEFKPHSHNCYEIIYFVSGQGNMIIDGKSFPVYAGTYCIVPPKISHFEKIDGYGEIIFIGFEHQSIIESAKIGVYHSADASTPRLFEKILTEYKRQDWGYEIVAQSMLNLLLIDLIRNIGTNDKKCKDLNYIKTYIEQYFNQKINFEQLANISGYSYDYFRHIFKNKFGVSPQKYMINIRLEKAKNFLEKSNLSCTEIAYASGFSNSAQMTTMFKKEYGKTPKNFKITD